MVVPCGDYAGIAERALRLLDHPELAEPMVERARRECLKYRWEAVRDAWMQVYIGIDE